MGNWAMQLLEKTETKHLLSLTICDKPKILREAEYIWNHTAARNFEVRESSIHDWRKRSFSTK
jgi:hypothetical protein